MFKRILAVLMAVMLSATLAAGCRQPARKPAPPSSPAPKTAPSPRTTRVTPAPAKKPLGGMPASSAELHKLATKLAGEAAKVNGVKKATVVLSNTTAYVGLDLKPNITGAKTNTIKKDVGTRVKKADKRLTKVYVSTDVDTVTRIKRVADGIAKGKPISSFSRELSEIARRIVPKTTR